MGSYWSKRTAPIPSHLVDQQQIAVGEGGGDLANATQPPSISLAATPPWPLPAAVAQRAVESPSLQPGGRGGQASVGSGSGYLDSRSLRLTPTMGRAVGDGPSCIQVRGQLQVLRPPPPICHRLRPHPSRGRHCPHRRPPSPQESSQSAASALPSPTGPEPPSPGDGKQRLVPIETGQWPA